MKKKILLFHYVGGAGGKFIANCLSFSKNVVFSDYNIAQSFLDNNDFNFLEEQLLNTIPEKQNSRQWLTIEKGCRQLFGNSITQIREGNSTNNLKLNDLSIFDGMWLPLMTHNIFQFNNCKKFFSNDTVVTVLVDGTPEFIDLAIRLKWKNETHCLDLDAFNKFKNDVQSMNFDFTVNNWDPLDIKNHTQITQLATEIGCNFDLILANNYIKKYINFHIR